MRRGFLRSIAAVAAGAGGALGCGPLVAAEPPPPAAVARVGTTQFRQYGHRLRVFLTADGRTAVSTTDSRRVNLWEAETGHRRAAIELPRMGVEDADFHQPSGVLAVIGNRWGDDGRLDKPDGGVTLIDVATRQVVRTIGIDTGGGSVPYNVRFTPDGKRVVGQFGPQVAVWDAATGEELATHKGKVYSSALAVSPDGKTVVFGRHDLMAWEWAAGDEPRKLVSLSRYGTERIAFAPDGKAVWAATGYSLTAYDLATGKRVGGLAAGGGVNQFAFGPGGQTVAVARYNDLRGPAAGHAVTLRDVATGAEVGRLPSGRGSVDAVGWSADGSRLAGVTHHRVWAWDAATGRPLVPSSPGHEGLIRDMAFAPDGRLFTAGDDGTVRSWDVPTGRPGLTLDQASWVYGVAVSPDGGLVAGSGGESDLRVWDTRTGAERYKLLGHGRYGGHRPLRFTPDGKRLVSWGNDDFVRTWDMRTGKLMSEHTTRLPGTEPDPDDPFAEQRELRFEVMSADLNDDGSVLVFGGFKGLRVVDTATGKERVPAQPIDPPNGVWQVAVSPDGKRLAVASRAAQTDVKRPNGLTETATAADHTVGVYELATGKVVWLAASAGTWPEQLRFSPDGSRLAETVRADKGRPWLRVWDAGGKEVGHLDLPDGAGHHIAFDRGGRKLAVSQLDTTAAVYDLEQALKPAK